MQRRAFLRGVSVSAVSVHRAQAPAEQGQKLGRCENRFLQPDYIEQREGNGFWRLGVHGSSLSSFAAKRFPKKPQPSSGIASDLMHVANYPDPYRFSRHHIKRLTRVKPFLRALSRTGECRAGISPPMPARRT